MKKKCCFCLSNKSKQNYCKKCNVQYSDYDRWMYIVINNKCDLLIDYSHGFSAIRDVKLPHAIIVNKIDYIFPIFGTVKEYSEFVIKKINAFKTF